MDLSKILNLIYRYLWLLVAAALIAGLVTFFQLSRQSVAYQATTDLLIGPGLDSPSPDLNSLKIGGQLGQTYAEVLSTPSFLEAVNNKLSQKVDLEVLKDAISTRQSIETRVLTIIVQFHDPKQAVAIANAAAQTLLEMSPSKDNIMASLRDQMSGQSHQLEQIVSESQTRIKELETQLAALKDASTLATSSNSDQQTLTDSQARIAQLEAELASLKEANPVYPDAIKFNLEQQNLVLKELADERSRLPEAANLNLQQQNLVVKELGEERSRLSDSLRTLATIYQILLATNTNQMEIIQPATTATLVDQQIGLRVLSSAIGGLIFALILSFIAEYFDDRLRFPGDLSRAAGAPLLSVIDKHSRAKGNGVDGLVTFAQPNSDAANRYREVVAKLLFRIGESMPYTLLVSSVGSKNGMEAAVSAGNLAVAFAQAGYKVALVDAQVDNPALTTMFKAEKKQGLTDLIVTKLSEPQLLAISQIPGFRLLPAGSSTEKDSHAMLNPANVAALFERLQKEADIVLVAGSAISRLAENLTLASQVDSVVLVARHAEARSREVSRVAENLRLMNINIVGVIFDYNSSVLKATRDRGISSTLERDVTQREVLNQSPLSEQTTKS